MLLKGRVAVVTGAGSGIGREIARVFAAEGARVAGFDLSAEAGAAVALELAAKGADRPFALAGDVRDPTAVEAAAAAVCAEAGQIDVLVNCAGTREIRNVLEITPEEWRAVIDVNLNGVFYWCQAAARQMRQTGGGSIVNLSSVGGLVGLPNRPAYTASKHAIVGLTKSLSYDLAPEGIRVNAICPGVIRTPMTEGYWTDERFERDLETVVPLGRAGVPDDVAQAALYLASPMSSYVTGVALPVDGGWLAEKSFAVPGGATSFGPPQE
ncbi:MAG TPA: SDR family NAD(P)-dependent oxidoreductase [Gaiellaceae bacterium]